MTNENDLSNAKIVVWEEKYNIGIELIDNQHKQLFKLTNQLYVACFAEDDVLQTAFKEAMSCMVEYVRFHFDAELKLLAAIHYPDYKNHQKKHEDLIKKILEYAKDYREGKKFVPNNFVRTLKDWILSHIAIEDKLYSTYVHEQIKKGALSLTSLKKIESSIST
jgi:hemerythrin